MSKVVQFPEQTLLMHFCESGHPSVTSPPGKSRSGYANGRDSNVRNKFRQTDFPQDLSTKLYVFRHLVEMEDKVGRRDAFGKGSSEPVRVTVSDGLMAESHAEIVADPEHSLANQHKAARP